MVIRRNVVSSFVVLVLAACDGGAAATQGAGPKVESNPAEGAAAAADAKTADIETTKAAEEKAPYEGPPKTVLVELFTSQGCDSCPAADAFVGTFPELGWSRDEVVALTYHVTYWDDLGWTDPYGAQLHDQRQIGYAQNLPSARADDENTIRGPYTPQLVVDGKVHFSGALEDVAKEQIESARARPTQIELKASASEASGEVMVQIESKPSADSTLDTDRQKVGLFVALAQAEVQTQIPRGENAGKTLAESWVVRSLDGPKLFRSGRPLNETSFAIGLPEGVKAAEVQAVVFAQDLGTLEILATAAVPLGS